MGKILQSSWFTILAGSLVFLGMTGFLLMPGNVMKTETDHDGGQTINVTGASWEFVNP